MAPRGLAQTSALPLPWDLHRRREQRDPGQVVTMADVGSRLSGPGVIQLKHLIGLLEVDRWKACQGNVDETRYLNNAPGLEVVFGGRPSCPIPALLSLLQGSRRRIGRGRSASRGRTHDDEVWLDS